MMHHQQLPPQPPPPTAAMPTLSHPDPNDNSPSDAPPKQVAVAMERLNDAGRIIADVRLSADRLLEALFAAAQQHHSSNPWQLILKEEAFMRQYLQDLRTIGKQLEDSGVLTDSLRSRSNSWGLHMPLVCPDAAVVAYAWKRQLAGQAGASAVDRTRLALKAFTDQKKRFFPHLDDDSAVESASKRHSGPIASMSHHDDLKSLGTISDILAHLEKECTNVKICAYQRLDWLKRAFSLTGHPDESSIESSKDHVFGSASKRIQESIGTVDVDRFAVIELFCPSVFRAIISLHPAGSIDPDAVAFFSPDEGGSYMHARGSSVHHAFRHITEHAAMALHHFIGINSEMALLTLLLWICSYQNLLHKACSKCGKLLSMDKQSALQLPPVIRPYKKLSAGKILSLNSSSGARGVDAIQAFHIGCSLDVA